MRNVIVIFLIVATVGLFLALTTRAILGSPQKQEMLTTLEKPGQTFESSQERARYILTQEIVDNKKFILDNQAEIALPDLSYKNGHYYSVFPPGTSLLIAPAYFIGQKIGNPVLLTFLMPALAAILCAIFIYLLALKLGLDKASAFLSALIFPLATISWSYSVTLYAHVFSALCIIAGLYFAVRARAGSDWNYFLVWGFYGLSILIDYPNAIIMLPVIIYLAMQSVDIKKQIVGTKTAPIIQIRLALFYMVVPFLLFAGLLIFYNVHTFGSWLDLSNTYRVTTLVDGSVDYRFAIDKALNFNNIENGLYTLIISKSRGIVFYSPILILSLIGLFQLGKRFPKFARVLAVICLLNLVTYASFYDPWGGWAYGPRYLIPAMPLLALLVGQSYQALKKENLYLFSFLILLVASFSIALLGALTTNLLPPPAEVGTQINFQDNLKVLFSNSSGSLIYNHIKDIFHLQLYEYTFMIIGLFLLIILPIIICQFFKNLFTKKVTMRTFPITNEDLYAD